MQGRTGDDGFYRSKPHRHSSSNSDPVSKTQVRDDGFYPLSPPTLCRVCSQVLPAFCKLSDSFPKLSFIYADIDECPETTQHIRPSIFTEMIRRSMRCLVLAKSCFMIAYGCTLKDNVDANNDFGAPFICLGIETTICRDVIEVMKCNLKTEEICAMYKPKPKTKLGDRATHTTIPKLPK